MNASTAFLDFDNSSTESKGSKDFKYFEVVSSKAGMGSLGIKDWLSNVFLTVDRNRFDRCLLYVLHIFLISSSESHSK
jgi:hypothetical protein